MAIVTFAWLPLVASGLAVVLSIASIYVSTREPEVVVILPEIDAGSSAGRRRVPRTSTSSLRS